MQVIAEVGTQLRRYCGQDSEEVRRYFDMLNNSVLRATMVTTQMLDKAAEQPVYVAPSGPASSPSSPRPEAGVPTPVAAVSAPGPIEDHGGQILNPAGPRELIMIVDDESFVTLLAQRVLIDEGYRVVCANDGFQALKLYRELKDRIALVILDFTMPIMDGAEVFEELLRINPRVAVMLSSGFTEQSKLKTMLAKGLRGFIPKPYTQQKLLLQVRSTLDAGKS
ncbi:MAG: response regulator [Chthoniobacteraceae bacterium]